MPEKAFALEPGGPERLELSWSGGFNGLVVALDGETLASFGSSKELKAGETVRLPDGAALRIRLAAPFLLPELQLSLDGEPVPGSAGDPAVRLQGAWGMITAVAALNAGLGLLALALGSGALQRVGFGWPSIIAGLVYAGLAFFVRRRSRIALAVAVLLFVLDGVFMLVQAASGPAPSIGGTLVARVLFLIPMLRGFSAIQALKRPPRRRLRPSGRSGSFARVERARGGSTAAPSAAAVAGTAAPAAAAARQLTGEAEKRRLEVGGVREATPVAPRHARTSISLKTKSAVDDAAEALRFVARRCQITDDGLHVVPASGGTRAIAWHEIGRIVVRALPPDPPWEGGLLLDLLTYVDGRWQPVRVFGPTIVNYGVLPGGPTTARLENVRRLARRVCQAHPEVALDDETKACLEGAAPARFADMTHFAEYDAAYG